MRKIIFLVWIPYEKHFINKQITHFLDDCSGFNKQPLIDEGVVGIAVLTNRELEEVWANLPKVNAKGIIYSVGMFCDQSNNFAYHVHFLKIVGFHQERHNCQIQVEFFELLKWPFVITWVNPGLVANTNETTANQKLLVLSVNVWVGLLFNFEHINSTLELAETGLKYFILLFGFIDGHKLHFPSEIQSLNEQHTKFKLKHYGVFFQTNYQIVVNLENSLKFYGPGYYPLVLLNWFLPQIYNSSSGFEE